MGQPVSWFELPADDPAKLAEFYNKAFGWTTEPFAAMPDYLIVNPQAGDGAIWGGITKRGMLRGVTNTITVPSLDDAMSAIKAHGGQVVTEKIPIPDMGVLAYAVDPEGNTFGIMESKPQ